MGLNTTDSAESVHHRVDAAYDQLIAMKADGYPILNSSPYLEASRSYLKSGRFPLEVVTLESSTSALRQMVNLPSATAPSTSILIFWTPILSSIFIQQSMNSAECSKQAAVRDACERVGSIQARCFAPLAVSLKPHGSHLVPHEQPLQLWRSQALGKT